MALVRICYHWIGGAGQALPPLSYDFSYHAAMVNLF